MVQFFENLGKQVSEVYAVAAFQRGCDLFFLSIQTMVRQLGQLLSVTPPFGDRLQYLRPLTPTMLLSTRTA